MPHKVFQAKTGLLTPYPATRKSVIVSKSLRTILLQDNYLNVFPDVLSSKQLFPALKVIQLHGKPIQNQSADIFERNHDQMKGAVP